VIQVKVSSPAVKQFGQALSLAGSPGFDPNLARGLLQPALDSQITALKKARAQIPTDTLMMLYARTRQGGQLFRAQISLAASLLSLTLLGQMRLNAMQDVVVSHPEIYPEVLLIGRPGVRLPYIKSFSLHYQIWHDKTSLTFMPGLHWKIANAEVASIIAQDIQALAQIAVSPG
jgi:hypothetical protein